MISQISKLIQLSTFHLFLIVATAANGQTNSGFLKGDFELTRYLEKSLVNADFKDTASYIFTIAAIQFDSLGKIRSVTYSSEGNNRFKELTSQIITRTEGMWDSDKAKKTLLLIPFEVMSINRNGEEQLEIKQRMLSYEFISLFKTFKTLKTVLLQPVIIINYASAH